MLIINKQPKTKVMKNLKEKAVETKLIKNFEFQYETNGNFGQSVFEIYSVEDGKVILKNKKPYLKYQSGIEKNFDFKIEKFLNFWERVIYLFAECEEAVYEIEGCLFYFNGESRQWYNVFSEIVDKEKLFSFIFSQFPNLSEYEKLDKRWMLNTSFKKDTNGYEQRIIGATTIFLEHGLWNDIILIKEDDMKYTDWAKFNYSKTKRDIEEFLKEYGRRPHSKI